MTGAISLEVSAAEETEPPSLDTMLQALVTLHRIIATRREQLAAIEARKARLVDAILARMAETDAAPSYSLVSGDRKWKIGRSQREVVTVTDWSSLYEHILATKDFSVINKALNQAAAKSLLMDHPDVTWLDRLSIPTLSITSTPVIPSKD